MASTCFRTFLIALAMGVFVGCSSDAGPGAMTASQPTMVLSRTLVTGSAAVGANPTTELVAITASSGSIGEISLAGVEYGLGAADWLSPTLSSTTAPANLLLAMNAAAGLPAGSYTAVVALRASAASNAAMNVTVMLTIVSPPRVVVQPSSSSVMGGQRATFTLVAESQVPLTYSWRRDGLVIPGATGASYTTDPTIRADSGSVFSVVVSNGFGSVTSGGALLRVTGVTVYGSAGFRPYVAYGDIVGVRFRVKMADNASQSVKLIFGTSRFYTPGSPLTYIVESNVYSGTHRFADGACASWPLAGIYQERFGSLRLAIPDYNFANGSQPGITTGIKATDPVNYPVQMYLIDGYANLFKSDAITQFDMTGLEALVTIERAETITDVSAFARCERPLVAGTYRRWRMRVDIAGRSAESIDFVMPDAHARYLTSGEPVNLYSEFIHTPGAFTVQYGDFSLRRESTGAWQSVTEFITGRYDGNGSDFGLRIVQMGGQPWVEFSNRAGNQYIDRENLRFSY